MSAERLALLRSLADDIFGPVTSEPSRQVPELGRTWDTIRGLEWPLVGIPEADGGAGGDLDDILALAEGVGRNAVAVPLLAAHTASAAAASGGRTDLLDQTLIVDAQARVGSLDVTLTGRGSVTISGIAPRVPWARHADTVIVGVTVGGQGLWLACDPRDAAVTITAGLNLAGEPRDDVVFEHLVVHPHNIWPAADHAIATRATLLRCAALVGAMEGTIAVTSKYVGEREQFGRPLNGLQSVAQSVALLRVQLSAARAAVEAAGQAPTATSALAAHVDIAGYAARTVRAAHDLHGAMGVAEEYPLHRWTTRLWAWPEEGMRQLEARALLGALCVSRGAGNLWTDLTA